MNAPARITLGLVFAFAHLAACGDDNLGGTITTHPADASTSTSASDATSTSVTDAAITTDAATATDAATTTATDAATTTDATATTATDAATTTATDATAPDADDAATATTPDADDATVAPDATVAADADASVATTCPPVACEADYPDFGDEADWRHPIATPVLTVGGARHRGRDLYLRVGDPQWGLAKFAYGVLDSDLTDEDVDVWLERGCGGSWEYLGVGTTTHDGDHDPVEGMEDSGGWIYFPIPANKTLGLGRHRLLYVVRGDHTTAEQLIEVLPAEARFVVSDVDGTQTESETAEFGAVFLGTDPAAQPHGAEALWAFADRGYHIFYLTARPEWLTTRTHTWLADHGYPPGNVHTTMTFTGSFNSAAETFKTDELTALLARFPSGVAFGVGNTASDEAAYHNIGLPADRAILYQFDPTTSGTRVDDYATLLTTALAQPSLCE